MSVNCSVENNLWVERPGFCTWILAFFAILLVNTLLIPFTFIKALTGMIGEKGGQLDLDLFDEQDIRTYATNVHHCLFDAVDKLMLALSIKKHQKWIEIEGILEIL